MAHRLRAVGTPGRRLRRRQLDRRPRGRPPRRARVVRQERQHPAARRRELVRARLRRHDRRAARRRARSPDGCGTCRRCLDACPTGAIVAPGVIDANRCLAWVLQRPGSIPEPLRAAIGDRIYGCDDCQEACPPTVRLGRRHRVPLDRRRRGLGRRARPARRRRRRRCSSATAAGTSPGRDPRWLRRNALVVLGNTGDPGDARVGGDARPLPPRRRPGPRRARPLGERPARPGTRRREAPPRHQRLPTQDRRDPVVAVGVVAAPAARPIRRADQPVPGRATLRRRAAVPHRADPGARAAAAPVDGPAHRRPRPRRRRRPRRARPGPAARPGRAVAAAALRRRAARRRGHRARTAARDRGRRWATCCAAPATSSRPGRYPAAEAERAAERPLPVTVVPPGVDTERFRPLDADERLAARRHFGLPTDGELIVSISRLVPAQGLRRGHRGRRPAGAAPARPRAGDLRRRPRRGPPAPPGRRARRPGAVPRARRQRRPARRCTAAATCSPWPAEPVGAGSSRRASASCSSRPRRAACRRWPANRAAPPRRSTTGSPASSSTGPTIRWRSPRRSKPCSTTPPGGPRWPTASRRRAVAEFSYDVLAERLGRSLGVW